MKLLHRRIKKSHSCAGFSLVELIIVIAIMAVLVGVLAPQFIKYVEKSRQAGCVQNRDSMVRTYMVARADDAGSGIGYGTILKDAMQKQFGLTLTEVVADKQYSLATGVAPCKSEGAYTFTIDEQGNLTITCEKHPEDTNVKTWTESMMDIVDVFKTYQRTSGYNDIINSTAPDSTNSHLKEVSELLAAAGFDLAAMGAKSWTYDPTGNTTLRWTSQDISSLSPGNDIIIMQYNFTSKHYTVWKAKVKTNTAPDGTAYNVIQFIGGTTLNANVSTQSTYEDAVKEAGVKP